MDAGPGNGLGARRGKRFRGWRETEGFLRDFPGFLIGSLLEINNRQHLISMYELSR